jgi:hypothetical protein
MSINRAGTEHQQSINRASIEFPLSINNLGYCILYDPRAVLQHLTKINVLAAFMGKEKGTCSQPQSENERQQSVNDFVCCILYHPRAALRYLSIFNVLATYIDKIVIVNVASPDNSHQQTVYTASTEPQQSIKRA